MARTRSNDAGGQGLAPGTSDLCSFRGFGMMERLVPGASDLPGLRSHGSDGSDGRTRGNMNAMHTTFVAILAILGFAFVLLVALPRDSGPAVELSDPPFPALLDDRDSERETWPDVELLSVPIARESAREDAGPVAVPANSEGDPETDPLEALIPNRDEDVVEWLRRVLPDKFADLTAFEIRNLADLNLGGADITDADLALLASLPNLRNLGLRGTKIGDTGLAALRGLDQLESLVLRGTQVTGWGMQNLPTQSLEALHLCGSQVTGADLVHLPPMPNLRVLKLNFLEVEDPVVEILGSYPTLRHIELDRSALTDSGLRRLLALNPALERIELRNTSVTADGAQALADAYPGCELVLDSGWLFAAHR